MRKRIGYAIFLLTLSAMCFSGCGRNNDSNLENGAGSSIEGEENVNDANGTTQEDTGLNQSQGNENGTGEMDSQMQGSDAFVEYQGMVQGGSDKESLYGYLEQYGAGVSQDEADQMIGSLFQYYDDPTMIDAERIMNVENMDMSDGMRSFLTAMRRENTDPTLDGNGIKVSQEELLNRSLEMENIYSDNMDSPVASLAYDRYNTLIHAAVSGGYDAGNNMPNSYADESGNQISQEAMDGYRRFIEANPDSKTAGILNQYVGVVSDAENAISDTVTGFYDTIKDTVRDIFDGV